MNDPVSIGLIGCGTIGRVHAASIAKAANCRVVSACDIEPSAVARVSEIVGDVVTTSEYRDVLADRGVAAVTVGLPNNLHASVTIEALRAGKHVFCEKPIATTYDDAVEMARVSEETGKRLVIGVVNRFADSVNQIKTIVSRGDLGEVYQINIKFKAYRSIPGLGSWFTDKSRSGGGVMIDWGVHYLDLVFYILDTPTVRSVSGKGFSRLARDLRSYRFLDMWAGPPDFSGVCDVEEYASGVIRTDGPFINFEGAWAHNINERAAYVDFIGDKGGIRLQYGGGFTVYGQTEDFLYEMKPVKKDSDFYVNEFREFADSIAGGKPNRADIERVLPVQKVLSMFYESSDADREILA